MDNNTVGSLQENLDNYSPDLEIVIEDNEGKIHRIGCVYSVNYRDVASSESKSVVVITTSKRWWM